MPSGYWQDPIFQDEANGGWFFFHEDWAHCTGPFSSRKEAAEGLRFYVRTELNGEAPGGEGEGQIG